MQTSLQQKVFFYLDVRLANSRTVVCFLQSWNLSTETTHSTCCDYWKGKFFSSTHSIWYIIILHICRVSGWRFLLSSFFPATKGIYWDILFFFLPEIDKPVIKNDALHGSNCVIGNKLPVLESQLITDTQNFGIHSKDWYQINLRLEKYLFCRYLEDGKSNRSIHFFPRFHFHP